MKYVELSDTTERYLKNHVIGRFATMVIYTIHGHEVIFEASDCFLTVAGSNMVYYNGRSYQQVIELCIQLLFNNIVSIQKCEIVLTFFAHSSY